MTYDKERYHNLLERLDPRYRAMLDDEETRYPYSVAKVKNELSNNIFYIDLPLGCVMSLANHLDLRVNNLHFISLIFDHNVSLYKQSVDNEVQERTEYVVVDGE
jgi:hypothetical protein